jgi:chromate transporter
MKEGLVPVALGLILASGISMIQTADQDELTVAISLATAGFVVFSRRNPLWAIGLGTGVNIAALRFGLLHHF